LPYTLPKFDDFSEAAIDNNLAAARENLDRDIASIQDQNRWTEVRNHWLARKDGVVTQLTDLLKVAPKDAKRVLGQRLNDFRSYAEQAIESAKPGAASASVTDKLDITLPGIRRPLGAEHPAVTTTNEILGILE